MPNLETGPKTYSAILGALKRGGPMDAQALARRFELTPMAVRLHLYALRRKRMVAFREVRRPRGRPAKLWRLTRKADAVFPDAHAELAAGLIASMKKTFGEKGLHRMLDVRARDQLASYRRKLPRKAPLGRRVEALARQRTREGYMAEVRRQKDGSYLLLENHCPICVAATACQGLCAAELCVFRKALGKEVFVERTEHILAGARRCAYRVVSKEGALPRKSLPP